MKVILMLLCVFLILNTRAQTSIPAESVVSCLEDNVFPHSFMSALHKSNWTLSDYKSTSSPIESYSFFHHYISNGDTTAAAFIYYQPDINEKWVMLVFKPVLFFDFLSLQLHIKMSADRETTENGEKCCYIGRIRFSFTTGAAGSVINISHTP